MKTKQNKQNRVEPPAEQEGGKKFMDHPQGAGQET